MMSDALHRNTCQHQFEGFGSKAKEKASRIGTVGAAIFVQRGTTGRLFR